MHEAAAVARWTEVRLEMFDEAIEGELKGFDRSLRTPSGGRQRHSAGSGGGTRCFWMFLDSRQKDPFTKTREHALQSLEFAYHKSR